MNKDRIAELIFQTHPPLAFHLKAEAGGVKESLSTQSFVRVTQIALLLIATFRDEVDREDLEERREKIGVTLLLWLDFSDEERQQVEERLQQLGQDPSFPTYSTTPFAKVIGRFDLFKNKAPQIQPNL